MLMVQLKCNFRRVRDEFALKLSIVSILRRCGLIVLLSLWLGFIVPGSGQKTKTDISTEKRMNRNS